MLLPPKPSLDQIETTTDCGDNEVIKRLFQVVCISNNSKTKSQTKEISERQSGLESIETTIFRMQRVSTQNVLKTYRYVWKRLSMLAFQKLSANRRPRFVRLFSSPFLSERFY